MCGLPFSVLVCSFPYFTFSSYTAFQSNMGFNDLIKRKLENSRAKTTCIQTKSRKIGQKSPVKSKQLLTIFI